MKGRRGRGERAEGVAHEIHDMWHVDDDDNTANMARVSLCLPHCEMW